jgi:hypothetical protein
MKEFSTQQFGIQTNAINLAQNSIIIHSEPYREKGEKPTKKLGGHGL